MKQGMDMEAFVQEVIRQSQSKVDMLAFTPSMRYATNVDDAGHPGSLILTPANNLVKQQYEMNDWARQQLARLYNIPYNYFERMREKTPELLDSNMNTWLGLPENAGNQHLIRTLDNRVRAVLSPTYRIVDNAMVLKAIMPMLNEMGLEIDVKSANLSERHFYLKVVSKRLIKDVALNDPVQLGVVIRNSEVGSGRLSVFPLILRLACLNGLIVPESGFKKTHVGRRLVAEDDLTIKDISAETRRLEDEALMSRVKDALKVALSSEMLQKAVARFQETVRIPIIGDTVEAVEIIRNKFELSEEDGRGILLQMMGSASAGENAYGLINAVTRYSQEVPDYDKATELEEIGGKLLALSPGQWKPIVEARPSPKSKEPAKLAA